MTGPHIHRGHRDIAKIGLSKFAINREISLLPRQTTKLAVFRDKQRTLPFTVLPRPIVKL
jgi:hypothetical protein